jgi:hypothetical protein
MLTLADRLRAQPMQRRFPIKPSEWGPCLPVIAAVVATALAWFWVAHDPIAEAQTTQPAPATLPASLDAALRTPRSADVLIYARADGGYVVLQPEDASFTPVNRDVAGASIDRPNAATAGRWRVASSQPAQVGATSAIQSATRPATLPATQPAWAIRPTDGVVLAPGADLTAALRATARGQKIYLERGGVYPPVRDATLRPHGVTLTSWGDPAKPRPEIRAADGNSALLLWAVDSFTLADVAVVGNGRAVKGAGLDLWGVTRFTAVDCEITGHRMGVTVQPAKTTRPRGVRFECCNIHHNSPTSDATDGSGLFAGAVDELAIVDCRISYNGWSATYRGSHRNHGGYIRGDSGPAVVTGNIIEANSSHGLQARSGGVITGNTFLLNPIHLSVGLVNGDGPIFAGGVRGQVADNSFAGTRPLAGKGRGWAIELGNVLDVEIARNAFRLPTVPEADGAVQAVIKIDVCNLATSNRDRGKEIGVRRLVIQDNAVSSPLDPIWVHPRIRQQLANTGTLTAQAIWPCAD